MAYQTSRVLLLLLSIIYILLVALLVCIISERIMHLITSIARYTEKYIIRVLFRPEPGATFNNFRFFDFMTFSSICDYENATMLW